MGMAGEYDTIKPLLLTQWYLSLCPAPGPWIRTRPNAKGNSPVTVNPTGTEGEPTRRDFLYIATGAMGAVGIAAAAWPFVSQMNPDASTRALASIDVDISSIE